MIKPVVFLIISITALQHAIAQDKPLIDPPELVTMREEYLRAMQRVAVPVLTAYLRQLESQKGFFTRQGKLDAALAIDKEVRDITGKLEIANGANARGGATMKLVILSSTYGEVSGKRFVDTTKNLRKAMEAGAETINLGTNDGAGGVDPAPFTRKENKVVYSINGQKKEKTFPEGHKLNFKNDLN